MDKAFTTVSSKGQIVIPAAFREKLGIQPGTRIAMRVEGLNLVLRPATKQYIRSLVGIFKGKDSLLKSRELQHRDEK